MQLLPISCYWLFDISPAATKIVADLIDFQDLSPMSTIDMVCCTDQ